MKDVYDYVYSAFKKFQDHGYSFMISPDMASEYYASSCYEVKLYENLDDALKSILWNISIEDRIKKELQTYSRTTKEMVYNTIFPVKYNMEKIHPFFFKKNHHIIEELNCAAGQIEQNPNLPQLSRMLFDFRKNSSSISNDEGQNIKIGNAKIIEDYFDLLLTALNMYRCGLYDDSFINSILDKTDLFIEKYEKIIDKYMENTMMTKDLGDIFLDKAKEFVEEFERKIVFPNINVKARTIENAFASSKLEITDHPHKAYGHINRPKIGCSDRCNTVQVIWEFTEDEKSNFTLALSSKEKKMLNLINSYFMNKLDCENKMSTIFVDFFNGYGNLREGSNFFEKYKNTFGYSRNALILRFPFGDLENIGFHENSLDNFLPDM